MPDKKIIALVLVGVLSVISLIFGMITSPKAKREVLPKAESIQEESSQVAEKIVPTKREAKETSFARWGRDPFVLKSVPVTTRSTLVLDGIMWHERNPKAMINNNIVGIGDEVDGNTVVGIKKDSVILNDGTKDFTLKLGY